MTTTVVTTIAIAGVGYGIVRARAETGMDAVAAGLVAAVTLLLVGVPAAFMWFHTVRVLHGNAPAAWRILSELRIVVGGMAAVGIDMLLFTAQLAAFGFLIGAFVVVLVCSALLNRVLVRHRVGSPPPNWLKRRFTTTPVGPQSTDTSGRERETSVGAPTTRRVSEYVLAGLTLLMAGLAVGGSFGAFLVVDVARSRVIPQPSCPLPCALAAAQDLGSLVENGWGKVLTGSKLTGVTPQLQPPLYGLVLAVAGALALVAGIVLPLRALAGRVLAVLAAGFLLGCVAVAWARLAAQWTNERTAAVSSDAVDFGLGAWLILAAGLVALATSITAIGQPPAVRLQYTPHPGPPSSPASPSRSYLALPTAATVLVAALLAVIGSALPLTIRAFLANSRPGIFFETGWTATSEPPGLAGFSVPLVGIPLVAAAVLVILAAAQLLTRGGRPGEAVRTRLLGIGACAALLGAVASIWLEVFSWISIAAAQSAANDRAWAGAGAGAWLLLLAAVAALLATGLLLLSLARTSVSPPSNPFQPWPQPGPAAPHPGWEGPHHQ